MTETRPDGSVIVTGIADGIGAAVADLLVSTGYSVVGIDLRPVAARDGLATIVGDVADPAVFSAAIDRATDAAPLRGLVSNAGFARNAPLHAVTDTDWDRIFQTNVGGARNGMRAVLRHWIRENASGSVVTISSTQAARGFRDYPAYSASKGALESLTRQVAADYGHRGIRINAVAPGVIMTPLNERLLAESEDPTALARSWDALSPLGRRGSALDVAYAVRFLLSDEASFITGHVLVVDGGQLALPPGTYPRPSEAL